MAPRRKGPLLLAFLSAVESNKNVDLEIDQAIIEAGKSIADAIDKITADEFATPTEKTKALYLTPHLVNILRELLATPLARKNVGLVVGETRSASRLSLIKDAANRKGA